MSSPPRWTAIRWPARPRPPRRPAANPTGPGVDPAGIEFGRKGFVEHVYTPCLVIRAGCAGPWPWLGSRAFIAVSPRWPGSR